MVGLLLAGGTLTLARGHPDGSLAAASAVGALALAGAGLGLVGAGVAAWRRWPQSGFGPLLGAAGLAWMFAELPNPEVGSALVFTFGLVSFAAAAPVLAHAALAYPRGRLSARSASRSPSATPARSAFSACCTRSCSTPAPTAATSARRTCWPYTAIRPPAELVERAGIVLAVAWTLGLIAVLVIAIVRSTPAARRTRAPVVAGAVAYLALVATGYAYSLARGNLSTGDVDRVLWRLQAAALGLIVLAPLAGRVRARWDRQAVARLAVEFGEAPPLGRLRDALARAVGDQSLELAFPVGDDR